MNDLQVLVQKRSGSDPDYCDVDSLRSRLGYDINTMRINGYDSSIIEEHRTFNAMLEIFLAHPLIGQYLMELTPRETFFASGIRIQSLEGIKEEMQALTPGSLIFNHGYLVFATSIGGNALCFHAASGKVFWADHTMSHDSITYKDRRTSEWFNVPFTAESLEKALVPLSDNIQEFLKDLLEDKLTTQLDALD